jgi:hypothetical protein
MAETQCFLCKKPAVIIHQRDGIYVSCKSCGEYQISNVMSAMISDSDWVDNNYILSGLAREFTENKRPKLNIESTNYKELISKTEVPNLSDINSKIDKLLRAIKKRSNYFGQIVELDYANDYTLAYAQNREEFIALINLLDSYGLIIPRGDDAGSIHLSLSAEGWKRLSLYSNKDNFQQGFICAWFHDSTKQSNEAIANAIKECSFIPMCIQDEIYKDTIMDKALSELRRSRFAIIDLTGLRPSVFYEAGFATALGIETIYVYKGELDDLEFYVKHFQCHKYETPNDLKEKLINIIRSRIN